VNAGLDLSQLVIFLVEGDLLLLLLLLLMGLK
jgi:hypothetical protein